MTKIATNLELATAAAAMSDLDEACCFVQDHFGQTDGGVAGMFFAGEDWSAMTAEDRLHLMASYVNAEAHFVGAA